MKILTKFNTEFKSRNTSLIMRVLLVTSVSFLVFGCDPYCTRDCGKFDVDAVGWNIENQIDSFALENSKNERISFINTAIYNSEPYSESQIGCGGGSNKPEVVTCRLTGIYTYKSADVSISIGLDFQQFEKQNEKLEDQSVIVSYGFNDTSTVNGSYYHSFEIYPEYSSQNTEINIFDSLRINNSMYYDVIESVLDTSDFVGIPNELFFYKLIASRDVGLIYLQDASGEEYFIEE